MSTPTSTSPQSTGLSKAGRHLTASLTEEQRTAFMAWRSDALSILPAFAAPLFNLRVLNAPGLGTFAVDAGYRLYIDFDAVMPLGPGYCSEALLHECSHLFAGHAALADDLGLSTRQELKVWNVAGDCAINDDLQDAGCRHVPNPQIHMLPESIGAERYQTPHHYYRHLRSLQAATQRKQIDGDKVETPVLTLSPARLPVGRVEGQLITARASVAFIDPLDFTVLLTTPDGAALPVSVQGANATTVGIILDADLPLGTYTVSVLSGGIAAAADLDVASPSISVTPDHIESGWAVPFDVKVTGDLTQFTPNVSVSVTDADGNAVSVGTPRRLSHTEVRFDLTARVADGMYVVTTRDTETFTAPDGTVTRTPVSYAAMLPIGVPHMSIDPNSLPVGYPVGTTLEATVSDFGFSTATTVEVYAVTPFGFVLLPGTLTASRFTSVTTAEFDLGVSLPEGPYAVVATNTTALGTVQAVGGFSVGGDGQDGSGAGEGDENNDQGQGESEGQGGSEDDSEEGEGGEPYKGCGSGAGGEAAPCELDADDDLGGTAPSASKIEQESIRVATAAAIQEQAAKNPGSVPGGLVQMAEIILAPSKTPWQKILGGLIRRSVASRSGATDIDRNRRSRRRHGAVLRDENKRVVGRPVYPGKYSPVPSITFVRDTSGSMSNDDLAAVGREIVAIAKGLSIKGDDLLVIDCDTQVHDPVPYRAPKSIEQVHGRGGTDMVAGIEAALAARKTPTAVVIGTDGYTPWPAERTPVPCIAVLIPQRGAETVPQDVIDAVPDWMTYVVVEAGDLAQQRAKGNTAGETPA